MWQKFGVGGNLGTDCSELTKLIMQVYFVFSLVSRDQPEGGLVPHMHIWIEIIIKLRKMCKNDNRNDVHHAMSVV